MSTKCRQVLTSVDKCRQSVDKSWQESTRVNKCQQSIDKCRQVSTSVDKCVDKCRQVSTKCRQSVDKNRQSIDKYRQVSTSIDKDRQNVDKVSIFAHDLGMSHYKAFHQKFVFGNVNCKKNNTPLFRPCVHFVLPGIGPNHVCVKYNGRYIADDMCYR